MVVIHRFAVAAYAVGKSELLLEDRSWTVHQDQFVKLFLVTGAEPRVRVEVKTRSKSKPVVKTYALPFSLDNE